MEIRQLEYYLVLCEELNYTRAAAKLYLSRQALRQCIAALETELCGPLLQNERNHLTLTRRGESLRRHAGPVVAQFHQMQQALDEEVSTPAPVRLGVSVALVPDYLPGLEALLERFRRHYPHVGLALQPMDNDAVAAGVELGTLDAALVMDFGGAASGLLRTALCEDVTCVWVAAGNPHWKKASIPLEALRSECLLVPGQRQDTLGPLIQACAAKGFALQTEIGQSFYQVNYMVQEQGRMCINRYEPELHPNLSRVRNVVLEGAPAICAACLQPAKNSTTGAQLLCRYLAANAAKLT